jgi:hypothetical protein
MIIATSDAHSWNQRLLIFTPSLLTHPDVVQTFRSARHGGPEGPHYFLCRLPFLVQQFDATIDRPRDRHRHVKPIAQLDDRADDGVDFHRPPGLEILQHRRLVRTNFFGAGHR